MQFQLIEKMKKLLLWRLTGLGVGVGIFATSLLMAHDVNSGSEESTSHKQLYFQSQVLPDNTIYPVLRAIDRVKLIATPRNERLVLLMTYGQHRLNVSRQLSKQNKPELTVTTLLKAHHYLMQAVDLSIETHQIYFSSELLSQLSSFLEVSSDINARLELADKSYFESIESQNISAQSRLEQILKTEH